MKNPRTKRYASSSRWNQATSEVHLASLANPVS
jgi:hypothetical protein